ncbi:hypothetical protein Sjap_015358 [Stephania japonica]|uniref:Uncharacterized protein n=1 Tax=Stephania japonica TaxID=461633 RepID=A0AAP0NTX1_9MAGN
MPVIGLYITIATSVCFFSILFDVISGFRNRKRWLPCRFFSLNSVTLTLLAIAAKIPVDLTTKMPSAHDQLSKLTGTTILVCICMGFLMPSLGINRKSENWSNVLSLSIFVVPVVVNICTQLYTGVIMLFREEHIINLELCKDIDPIFTGVICIVSSVVLVQAVLRCFIQKEMMFPCNGSSDYECSTWIIVGTQIATILIGSVGTGFRLVTLAHHMKLESLGLTWAEKDANVINENPLLELGIKSVLVGIPIYLMYSVIMLLTTAPYVVVRPIWERCRKIIPSKDKDQNSDDREEYLPPIEESDEQGLELWSNAPVRASPNLLIDQLRNLMNRNSNKAYEVSSLSVVLLARIATVCSIQLPAVQALEMNPSKVFKISDTQVSQLNNDIVLESLKDAQPADLVQEELHIITDFIKHQNCRSIQELDNFTQLFVEILNEFLKQLPNAIYKEIAERSLEDYEKVTRLSLKLLRKVESLEAYVPGSYPIGTTIDTLITNGSNGE